MVIRGRLALLLQRTFDNARLQMRDDVVRMHAHQIASTSAIDVDQRQVKDAFFQVNRERFLGAEWRGTADQVAGMAVGGFGRAGRYFLDPDLTRQFLGRYFALCGVTDQS